MVKAPYALFFSPLRHLEVIKASLRRSGTKSLMPSKFT